jgi:hypothetical protein
MAYARTFNGTSDYTNRSGTTVFSGTIPWPASTPPPTYEKRGYGVIGEV